MKFTSMWSIMVHVYIQVNGIMKWKAMCSLQPIHVIRNLQLSRHFFTKLGVFVLYHVKLQTHKSKVK
jgi:hypothetical protein